MSFIRNILNSRSHENGDFFLQLKKILGFKPKTPSIYLTAFTHRSMNIKDDKGNVINYERLEFVGDAILGSVIAAYLFEKVPHGDEGYLTKMRSKVVSREHLNKLGEELGLIDFVESKIPKSNFGNNIHGNLFEALVGAIYLDKGYSFCEKFIYKRVIDPHIDIEALEGKVISYKSLLIEWCQKEKNTFDYQVYEDTGNDELKHFSVKLLINDKVISKARATSKKKAEEKASKRAFFAFQNEITKLN
ncbi:ribonuclease III [Winogradskyella bathintestinalis]|uniref:Ribonuclease 3 n=1 Tax=Winogradskyella bathintestinalis TaxID=3035208 RepID=A0ABT7ZR09_9FLAO|nr:ribonuclease III [Winogradskyella bathintestinalis]MDN3491442.1 ribonuclease III [Winogradskyella bathintestinalis]